MCWWGIAWASGPNINAGMDSSAAGAAREAILEARDHLDGATERERAYVEAMTERYGPDPMRDRASQDTAYARAMRDVADRWPSDDDTRVLAAEALMLLSPWDCWTEEGEPKPGTGELLERLHTVTHRNPDHAGACHFYLHAVEAAHPEQALPCADRIADLMPGAGHVVHMPGHVYIRVGRYADAIEANRQALRADSAAASERREETAYTLAYHPHNYHFLSYAAAMAGQSEPTLEEARVWDLNATADLLGVAVKLVEGELAAARGDHDEAVAILEEGLRRETELVYDEPLPWHLPVRHVLGAVLLEAGRAAESEAVYRRALERFPENGYALKGLVQSLEEQGRSDEAEAVRERFREAWRAADVELPASRY